MAGPRISAVHPPAAVEGGRVTIEGSDLLADESRLPEVHVGEQPARVVRASRDALSVVVPAGGEGGRTPVRLAAAPGETAFLQVGRPVATGLHQVDNPAVDADGAVYVTYSGTRGERSPVSVFRVRRDGFREPFVTGITNATSLAFAPDGRLHVSSRFEGTVYRVAEDGTFAVAAADLGVTCGIAFSPDGALHVGDRSGTVFRMTSGGKAVVLATLPPSVAAYHLAWGPDDGLYVAGPTLSSYDSVYRIDRSGKVDRLGARFGRPQGLAFDAQGALHVVEALAGLSGLRRLDAAGESATPVVAARSLVGVAFDPAGGLVVASGDTVYRLDALAP